MAEGRKRETKGVVVKKYANRRLYDMSSSTYVTLDDLRKMVKDGIEFTVADAKTGEDLTRAILTQIIFEQESKGYNLLPIGFLRQIIGFYGDNLASVLPSYLENMMENFTRNQDRMRSYMGGFSPFAPFKNLEEIGKQNMELFEKTMSMFSPFGGKKDTK